MVSDGKEYIIPSFFLLFQMTYVLFVEVLSRYLDSLMCLIILQKSVKDRKMAAALKKLRGQAGPSSFLGVFLKLIIKSLAVSKTSCRAAILAECIL
jgi:hypothetical protein